MSSPSLDAVSLVSSCLSLSLVALSIASDRASLYTKAEVGKLGSRQPLLAGAAVIAGAAVQAALHDSVEDS